MATRIIAGQHPNGPFGLFISKAGVEAKTADPNAIDPWVFSSQWGNVCGIIMSGQIGQDTDVTFPVTLGFKPLVLFYRFNSSINTFNPDAIASTINSTVNDTRTAYKVTYGTNNFRIVNMTSGLTGGNFIFVVFNLRCEP